MNINKNLTILLSGVPIIAGSVGIAYNSEGFHSLDQEPEVYRLKQLESYFSNLDVPETITRQDKDSEFKAELCDLVNEYYLLNTEQNRFALEYNKRSERAISFSLSSLAIGGGLMGASLAISPRNKKEKD